MWRGEEYTPDYALPYIYPGWLEIWNFFISLFLFVISFVGLSLLHLSYFVCRIFLWIHRRQLCSTLYIPCLVRDGTTQKLLDFSFTDFTAKNIVACFYMTYMLSCWWCWYCCWCWWCWWCWWWWSQWHNPSDPAPCYPNTPQLMTGGECGIVQLYSNYIWRMWK